MRYSYEMLKADCDTFNEIAGNHEKTTLEDIEAQYNLILEEVKEIKDKGIDQNNVKEVLDGAIDTLVTTFGLIQKLESLGVDCYGASKETADNNLSKFPEDDGVIKEKTINLYKEQGIHVAAYWDDFYKAWVFKDANGKVRKPFGFVSNDLSKFIPESLLKNGFAK